MKEIPKIYRKGNTVSFTYTFLDDSNAAIPLTGYSVSLLIRPQSGTLSTVPASLLDATAGQVALTDYLLTTPGTWLAQFVATSPGGTPIYGEIAQFTVEANLSD